MLWNTFDKDRAVLLTQYSTNHWNTESGEAPEVLDIKLRAIADENENSPKEIIRAKLLTYLLGHAQIEVNPLEWFADKINCGGAIFSIRDIWQNKVANTYMKDVSRQAKTACAAGFFTCGTDFGHTAPEWSEIYRLGIAGLRQRARDARSAYETTGKLTDGQRTFYDSVEMTYTAVISFLLRLADEAQRLYNENNTYEKMTVTAACLRSLAYEPPHTLLEVMQLTAVFFRLQEFAEGERVRSLGIVDQLYYPYYKADLDSGRYTKTQLRELLCYYLNKFWAAKIPFDLPLCIGGTDADGNDTVNEFSYMFVETYSSLNIYSPKVHVRWHDKSDPEFIKPILASIRAGNSSFVFVNDKVAVDALKRAGIDEREARNYIPIGCYEPAASGREVPCTGNGSVNIPKAVELTLNDGFDHVRGCQIGPKTGDPASFDTYESFFSAVKAHLRFAADSVAAVISEWERHYMEINPAPLYSGTLKECVESGIDAYAGGAKYNNSSPTWMCIATAVDSLCAIKRVVYDEHRLTLTEFARILRENWMGNEPLRSYIRAHCPKYGNGDSEADETAKELADYIFNIFADRPNGRGGIFKAGFFSIDYCHKFGLLTGASADGRYAGEPLSKNLCAVAGMDKKGLTGVIRSVTSFDHAQFANGSVLDIIIHPSAVQGDDGLDTMYALIKTYFSLGGFAMHGNVMDAQTLIDAQTHKEQYATLQVRLCGWNVYFVDLSKPEQDELIRQAKGK